MPEYTMYNYSAGFMATHQNLRRMQTLPMENEIPEKNGIGVLFYHTRYIKRMLRGFCFIVQREPEAATYAPIYDLDPSGTLYFRGSIGNVFPAKIFFANFLSKLTLVQNL